MENLPEQDPSYLRPGTQVGEWRVVRGRGRGSYGAVYRVVRVGQESGEPFALKVALSPQDERFEREVELLSRVRPGHVPRLVSSGVWRGADGKDYPYFVMEWIPGEPLYLWAERHKPTEQQVMTAVAQVARGLEAVHAVEAVHRDVKGDNVLVGPEGRAVLMDFGSCWYPGARRLTGQREPVGTPEYWSPEALTHQWRHRRQAGPNYQAGPADDVYALGVMAYRLVVGAYPPELEVVEERGQVARRQRVEPEALVTVSPQLAALIRQLLSDDPAARGHAGQVAEAFERAAKRAGRRANHPITRRQVRTSWWKRPQLWAQRFEVAALGWMGAALLAGVLLGHGWAERAEPGTQRGAVAGADPEGSGDAGTAALGQGALTERVSAERPEAGGTRVSVEVLKKPLPGQRRPPCTRHEIEIQGGCWISPQNAVPPCGDGWYEWQHRCYWPVVTPDRPSTSEPP